MRALGAVTGFEGGRAEGGLEVGLANPPGRLSEEVGKLGSRGEGGVAPMVRLTEVRYEGGGLDEDTRGSTASSRSESEDEMSCRRCCWDEDEDAW